MEHIKVNIPAREVDYENGNGEGVFVLVEEDVKRAYDNDEDKTVYTGILDNESIYWDGLVPGTKIKFEMRGTNRPIVSWDWILDFVMGNAKED